MNSAPALPPAVSGERHEIDGPAGRLAYYVATPAAFDQPPLLLIHSVNACASAYEMRPIYEALRARIPVYAVDLPGFGFSERADRPYSPRIMTDAVHRLVAEIRKWHGASPIDALALSLGCEFLARAAIEAPANFRTIGLVSPTGFRRSDAVEGPAGSDRGRSWLLALLRRPPWRKALFDALTSRASIRYFLRKTFGSDRIDEALLDYDWLTARQPGARHAPYRFVSGFLFSADVRRLYRALACPVWMAHGVRGDFTDYRGKDAVADRTNWTIRVFDAGALPHFEQPDEFIVAYDAFRRGGDAAR